MEDYSVTGLVVSFYRLWPVYGSYCCGKIAQIKAVKFGGTQIIFGQSRNFYRIIDEFGKLVVADTLCQAIYRDRRRQHGIIFFYGIRPRLGQHEPIAGAQNAQIYLYLAVKLLGNVGGVEIHDIYSIIDVLSLENGNRNKPAFLNYLH